MAVIERTTPTIALARKARHRKPTLCLPCKLGLCRIPRWTIRSLAVIALITGILFDLRQFGVI